jgi:biotin carboxylase
VEFDLKSIIMIGGGIQEVPAVIKLKKFGYRVIIIDRNKFAPAVEFSDINVVFDGKDIAGIVAWILAFRDKYNISGIFTLTNLAPTVSLVANATNLPALPVNVVMGCDNKLLMKRRFVELNLPTAKYYEVSTPEEVVSIVNENENKLYCLKVADGFGGKGIKFIKNVADIPEAFNLMKQFTSFPVLLLEEVLEGDFIDVQGVFHNDKFYQAGSADSYFSNEKPEFSDFNPVEIFNVSPSQQSQDILVSSYALLEEASRKMRMTWGPVGADFILTKKGLKIIEIGPRLHGPNGTLRIFPASTGIEPLEFMAQCVCGDDPLEKLLVPKFDKVALCHVFISSKKDIDNVGFSVDPTTLPGLFAWNIYHGSQTTIPKSNVTLSGLAAVFVIGDSYEEAMERLEQVKTNFKIC